MKLFRDRKEFLAVFLIAVGAAIFSLLPTIYAWLNTPQGLWFSGFNRLLSPVDINTYLAAMRQGFNGNWLWQNQYTAEAASSYPLYFSYLSLGHLARLGRLPLPFIFHLSGFVFGVILLLILYVFITYFVEERRLRYFCFALVALGGGLVGWSEATVFNSLGLPHFVLDNIFFVLTLGFGFLGINRRDTRATAASAVAGLLLSTIHPYSLFVAGLVLGGYVVFSGVVKKDFWVKLKFLSPLLIASVVSLALFAKLFSFNNDLIIREWLRQQIILSPPPYAFLFGYGLLSILALFGLRYLWDKRDEKSIFLLSWVVLHFSVIYLPVQFQLRMLKGFFVAFCLLATFGVKKLTFLTKENIALVLIFSVFISLTLQFLTMTGLEDRSRLVYLTAEEGSSFSWIRENIPPDSLFLSSHIVGNFLPAQTDARSYFGHGILTTRFDQKKKLVERFYDGKMDGKEAKRFLEDSEIDYVFCGPDEKVLEDGCSFGGEYLEEVYENEKVKIFKVL